MPPTGPRTLLAPERPVASSVEELLAGATRREAMLTADSKSGARFERVTIDGEPHVVKYLHVDDDWIMRSTGDLACRPVTVWRAGILDRVPPCIDHGVVGAATGLGRNGWGAALLMRDMSPWLVPEGDESGAPGPAPPLPRAHGHPARLVLGLARHGGPDARPAPVRRVQSGQHGPRGGTRLARPRAATHRRRMGAVPVGGSRGGRCRVGPGGRPHAAGRGLALLSPHLPPRRLEDGEPGQPPRWHHRAPRLGHAR